MKKIIKGIALFFYKKCNNKCSFGRNVCVNFNSKYEGNNRISNDSIFLNSNIGMFSYIGSNCYFHTTSIGRFSSIGSNVRIVAGKHPISEFISTHPIFYSCDYKRVFNTTFVNENYFSGYKFTKNKKYVEIGNDVWIGDNVLIMQGVSIGDGAVIGAGSIVVKDVEPYTVNVGIPSQKIRFRYNADVIDKLMNIKWWNFDISFIQKNHMKFLDVDAFLKEFYNEK